MGDIKQAVKIIHDYCTERELCDGCEVKAWCDRIDRYHEEYENVPTPDQWEIDCSSTM